VSLPWKQRVRRLLNFPRYGEVPLDDPQQHIEVWLEGAGNPRNVTRNNVVAALRPFTIGVMFDADSLPGQEPRLCMREAGAGRLLGAIRLRAAGGIALEGRDFRLFEAAGCENYCVAPANLRFYYLRERWRAELRQRRNPFNFRMTAGDLRASYVFYICPRPVVLVTAEYQGASNTFPMDLIGPTDSPWFSMALRSTSPAVRLMQQARRMALAGVPFRYRSAAYELAKHHRIPSVDLAGLPFATRRSPEFGLPVMEEALRVREVRVEEFHEVGSHVLFLTSMVSDTGVNARAGRQLFHAFSSYRQWLALGGDAESTS
jgi:flavin reductase (DIM6/NTAB) family NADH-FMN oxidoreductase RutF